MEYLRKHRMGLKPEYFMPLLFIFLAASPALPGVLSVEKEIGTGGKKISLRLMNAERGDPIGLTLHFSAQATEAIPEISRTQNFYQTHFKKQRDFLESLKYEHGYVDAQDLDWQSTDPRFAYYFWKKDNGHLRNGKMKIRRYPGQHQTLASVQDEISDGPFTYTAYFKAGVVAYDHSRDDHYVLYHPEDMYAWPTVMKKSGAILYIGTRGEGLTLIDLKKFRIKKFEHSSVNPVIDTIEVNAKGFQINGGQEIPFSSF